MTFSKIFCASSTFLLLAASISITSIGTEFVISRQFSHSPQGFIVGPLTQFRDLAKILAVEVLPVPRGPVKRYACEILSIAIAFESACLICSCPTTSSSFCGRYFLYKGIYFSESRNLQDHHRKLQYNKNSTYYKPGMEYTNCIHQPG